jgi:hypothetical protein
MRLFIIISLPKSGLFTSNTRTLTGFFSKTHFILCGLSNCHLWTPHSGQRVHREAAQALEIRRRAHREARRGGAQGCAVDPLSQETLHKSGDTQSGDIQSGDTSMRVSDACLEGRKPTIS